MEREIAIEVAKDMWGCIVEGHTIFPLNVIRPFLSGAYVCVEAYNFSLDQVISMTSSESSERNESLDLHELISIVDVIAKAQAIPKFDIHVYGSAEFQSAPLPPTVMFVEAGLPRPSGGQINLYRKICCDEGTELSIDFGIDFCPYFSKHLTNVVESLVARWKAAQEFKFFSQDIRSLSSMIRSCLQHDQNDRLNICEALLATYLLDLRVSGFEIPNVLPDIIFNHVRLWFDIGERETLQPSNTFLALFPMTHPYSHNLIHPIITRLFANINLRDPWIISQEPKVHDETSEKIESIRKLKRRVGHESTMLMMRLLSWIQPDLMTLPHLPNARDVNEFSRGQFIGPTAQNFVLEWNKRPGAGWNYAATQMFLQMLMKESQSYSQALISESDLRKQTSRQFSYLRRKRKEKLVKRDGSDSERDKIKEETTKTLKAKRRGNRRKALFKHRLSIVSATPEWPTTASQALICLGSDGTSSDETDSDSPKLPGGNITYQRVPKICRSVEIDQLIRAVDAQGVELSKRKRVGQPFRQRTGDHPDKVQNVIIDGLPENFYNINWLSKRRPDAMALLRIGVSQPIPRLSTSRI